MTTDAFLRRTVETPTSWILAPLTCGCSASMHGATRKTATSGMNGERSAASPQTLREIGRIPADTPKDQLLVAAHAAFIFNKPELPAGYALVGDGFNMLIEDSATGRPLCAFEGADE